MEVQTPDFVAKTPGSFLFPLARQISQSVTFHWPQNRGNVDYRARSASVGVIPGGGMRFGMEGCKSISHSVIVATAVTSFCLAWTGRGGR
jgi:hypothetical protein